MKYWTKEVYEEMQAFGLPGFYETEAELEEAKQWAIEDGHDFVERAIEYNDYRMPLWEQYLPRELVEYARNHQMLTCYLPEPKVLQAMEHAKQYWEDKWNGLCNQYVQHYQSILNQLPAGAIELQENCHIHDAKIIAVRELPNDQQIHNTESYKTIEIRLAHDSEYGYRFTFEGVTQFVYDVDILNNICLYKEIDREGEQHFAFGMLLCNAKGTQDSMNQMSIVFQSVTVEQGTHLGAVNCSHASKSYGLSFRN